jgi:TetR/AcrR family transcriptional repressor of nem operon
MLILMGRKPTKEPKLSARDKILNAAFTLIRTQGYSSTTIDELCDFAGVAKGSFFHHFENKEALAIEAAKHWSLVTGELFKSAPYHRFDDPLERFIGYLNFRKEILQGETPEFTCLVGTMVQEAYHSHPEIREACFQSIFCHAETLEKDIADAIKLYRPRISLTAKSLALHTQAVIQGAFILAKASGNTEVAAESIEHLLNYVRLLFNKSVSSGDETPLQISANPKGE